MVDENITVDVETAGMLSATGHRDAESGAVCIVNRATAQIFLHREFEWSGYELSNHMVYTVQISRQRLPDLPNHWMGTVARHLSVRLPIDTQLHRVIHDERLVAKSWLAMENMK